MSGTLDDTSGVACVQSPGAYALCGNSRGWLSHGGDCAPTSCRAGGTGKWEAGAWLELKRRRAVFDALREKARKGHTLDLADYRLITCEFFQRLHFDTSKQFVVLNGYITPAMAKQRKVEPTGADNGNDYTKYFQKLAGNADLKQLGAWLLELALIQHRDHAPYSDAGDKTVRDPLFETARRWGVSTKPIASAVEERSKTAQPKKTTQPSTKGKAKKS